MTSLWSKLEDITKLLTTKGYVQFVTPMQLKMKIHFLCYCTKYFKLRNKFFAQIQSHLHNFQQLSYSDLVIKLMNSEDIYLNLRLTNYISLLNNLRDSILSSKNDVTWLSVINIIFLFLFVLVFTYLLQYCK